MRPLHFLRLATLSIAAFFLGVDALRAASVAATLTTDDLREQQREGRLIVEMLQNFQYADRQLVDIDATEVIDRFLQRLDPGSAVLSKDEVEFLHRRFDRRLKSVYLLKGDLQPAYEIYDYFVVRAHRRLDWVKAKLAAGLDLTVTETRPVVRDDDAKPAADAAAADRQWELRLKDAVIASMLDGRDEAAAIARIGDDYARWGKQIDAMDAIAVREVFLDGFIGLFDPHSGYFSAANAEEFETSMRGTVGGAGLAVRLDEGRCLVDRVLPAGPAEEEGELEPGDELLAAASGDDAWVDLTGKRLPAVLALLRGPADSTLRLAWRRGDASAPRAELSLKRRNVVLVEDRARGAVIQVGPPDGTRHPIGWIDLPAFYAAGEGDDSSSVSRDVRELLEQMSARGVEGLVVDLRRNPGGAMTEAVKFAGLFAPGRTVLVARDMDGRTEEMKSEASAAAYAGPLVLLISHASASASEIVAGALRGDGRALVVGARQTFGKGTAQNYVDLNRSPAHAGGARLAWGTLRLTSQRFYFPDGHSPQLVGAASDVVLPMHEDIDFKAERDLPHALAAETIERPPVGPLAAELAAVDSALLEALRAHTKAREAALPEFALDLRREQVNHAAETMTERSVELRTRRAAFEADEAVRDAWLAEYRALMAQVAYASEPVDTKAVGDTLAQHATFARRHRPAGLAAGAGWRHGGIYFVDHGEGRLRQVALGRIDFAIFEPQVGELDAAFGRAAGKTLGAEAMHAVLRRLGTLDERTDRAVDAVFAAAAADVVAEKVRAGADAVLGELTRIEPSLLYPGRGLDVSGRESLRLAADWAARRQPVASTAPVAPAASAPSANAPAIPSSP